MPGWFAPYISLESAANLIQVYDTAVIPACSSQPNLLTTSPGYCAISARTPHVLGQTGGLCCCR